MSPQEKRKVTDLAEKETVDILIRRSKRKIPEMHPLEELNLVPYLDVMVNLIIFMLVTISAFLPLGILSIFPPTSSSGKATDSEVVKEELTLSVFIMKDGFIIAGIGGAMPPIPVKPDGEYDYETLQQKAVEIKDVFPNETKVIIAAETNIKYDILIKVMDTLRNKGEKVLFTNVQLSPGLAQAS